MNSKAAIYLFPILALALSSCAKKIESKIVQENSGPSQSEPQIIFEGSKPDAEKVFKDADLLCGAEAKCPQNVGLLTLIGIKQTGPNKVAWTVSTCTASLIGQDILLTNSHCIPADMKADASISCQDRLVFTTSEGHQARCQTVLDFTELDSKHLGSDLALIQLEKKFTKIDPIEFDKSSRNSLVDSEEVYSWSVDPQTLLSKATLRKKECRIAWERIPFSTIKSSDSSIMSFLDCPIIPGNSGSPLFSSKRSKLIGVVQAILKKDIAEKFRVEDFENNLLNFASHIKCVNLAELNFNKTSCSDKHQLIDNTKLSEMDPEIYKTLLTRYYQRNHKSFLNDISTNNKDIKKSVDWKYSEELSSDSSLLIKTEIKCSHQSLIEGEEIKVLLPFWSAETYLTKDYKLALRTTKTELVETTLQKLQPPLCQ